MKLCIHTYQGLEVDYVAVTIGEDLIVKNGQVITVVSKYASSDKLVHVYKNTISFVPHVS